MFSRWWLAPIALVAVTSGVLCGQDRVVIVRHESTPEGDIVRARADAALLLQQAELVGQKANAQRLDNMLKECDVAYQRMVSRNKTKGTLESKFDRTFDVIMFNQQLAGIRSELEQKAIMQRTGIGDTTDAMNLLLENFARKSFDASGNSAMRTELSPEQLDAIYLTDGSNTFSAKTGRTRLENFRWPFFLQRKEFAEERNKFEAACDEAIKQINAQRSPSPETIVSLLKHLEEIRKTIDTIPLSEDPDVRSVETKWRKEATLFIRELTRTLGNVSRLDSEKLARYVFQGKTLGELVAHMESRGLRFSHPIEGDANLYASVFFIMRYADQMPISATKDTPVLDQGKTPAAGNGTISARASPDSEAQSDLRQKTDLQALYGTWDVRVDINKGHKYKWTFSPDGTFMSTKDNGLKSTGKWSIDSRRVIIHWGKGVWDSFDRPIDTNGITGDSSAHGSGVLHARKEANSPDPGNRQ